MECVNSKKGLIGLGDTREIQQALRYFWENNR